MLLQAAQDGRNGRLVMPLAARRRSHGVVVEREDSFDEGEGEDEAEREELGGVWRGKERAQRAVDGVGRVPAGVASEGEVEKE